MIEDQPYFFTKRITLLAASASASKESTSICNILAFEANKNPIESRPKMPMPMPMPQVSLLKDTTTSKFTLIKHLGGFLHASDLPSEREQGFNTLVL